MAAAAVVLGSQLLASAPGGPALADPGDGAITVNVIRDVNGNGTFDPTLEVPVAGISVAVEDDAGTTVSGVTDAAGTVTLDPSTLVGGSYRVRATIPPELDYLQPAPTGGGLSPLVSYVNVAGGVPATLTMGVWNPSDYMGDDPRLITTSSRSRLANSGGLAAVIELGYTDRGVVGTEVPDIRHANLSDVGATFGVATHTGRDTMLVGSSAKVNVSYGPGGNGAIYAVPTVGAGATVFATVPDVGASQHSTLPDARETAIFGAVGRESLGDLELSEDGSTLYAVNLFQRSLVVIDAATGTIQQTVPITDPGCSDGDWRPYGLGFQDGMLYVGGVCSAETSGDRANLRAAVYEVDPATLTFGTPVVFEPLDQARGRERGSAALQDAGLFYWNAWTDNPDDWAQFSTGGTDHYFVYWYQPMLTDIEKTPSGDLLLAFENRLQDQISQDSMDPRPGNPNLYIPDGGGGDINKVCLVGGSYVWEGDAGCDVPPSETPNQASATVPVSEYYSGEYFDTVTNGAAAHNEVGQGGLVYLPGFANLAITSTDPNGPSGAWAQGVRFLDNTTGGNTGGAVFQTDGGTGSFRKGSGMGDLEVLAAAAPVQIGNRTWFDTDQDGIEDPSEPSIPGATVNLLDAGGATVATTTTDAGGLYTFGAPDVLADTAYTVQFDFSTADTSALPGAPTAADLQPTTADVGGDDEVDSDADAAGVAAVTTGPAGAVDHSIDAGVFAVVVPPSEGLTGTIFRDYNMDGCMSTDPVAATDVPVAGVVVNAYDDTGAVVGTATTDANGVYALALPDGTTADQVRVQYELPAGYQPGPVNSVDGCTTPSSPNPEYPTDPLVPINFGLVVPGDYCQSSPNIATICQRGLNAAGTGLVAGTTPTLYTLGSEVTGTPAIGTGAGDLRTQATLSQTGTVWGMASYGSNFVWSAAALKRHTPVGPGGLGAIYLTQTETGTPNATPWVTIPNVGTNPRPGSSATGSDDPILGSNDWFHDPTVWPVAGKIGLGDIDISADNSTLYAINLNDKQLYAVPVVPSATPGGAPTAGTPVAIPLPTALSGAAQACADEWLRPWAVEADAFGVWVGMTCTGPTQADLHSYVYRMDPATSAFDAAPAFEMALSGYDRSCAFFTANGSVCDAAVWQVWDDAEQATSAGGQYIWAQPLLSDIEFDSNGDITMGIMDRTGLRIGDNAGYLDTANTATMPVGNASGDLLRACGTRETGWVLESNSSCGTRVGNHAGQGGGPGGGEFYTDYFTDPTTGNRHDEKTLGATEQIPGFPTVKFTVFDPFNGANVREGGIQSDSNTNGEGISAVRVYGNAKNDTTDQSAGTFGKAGSMGDIEALCDLAPLEIGNYVWIDTDLDGVQDPTEAPVPGVTVNLYDATNAVVGTTTTNPEGEYYFNNANVTGGLLPTTAYTVRIDNPADYAAGAPLDGYSPTIADAPPDDVLDSDATLVDGFGQISLTTGPAGDVNHTYDFGFIPAPEVCGVGDYVWIDTNGDGEQGDPATEPVVAGATVTLFLAADDSQVATTTTDASGLYLFDQIGCDEYYITFTPPAGQDLAPTAQETDPTSATGSNPDPTGRTPNFTLDPATTPDLTIDAGYVPAPPATCAVGDFVWTDTNANGIQDTGEAGIAGVTVELLDEFGQPALDAGGTLVPAATTDADGGYVFDNLSCGRYIVRFSNPPAGTTWTPPAQGDDRGTDSNPYPTTGETPVFTVAPGDPDTRPVTPDDGVTTATMINPTIDAGVITPLPDSISGRVFRDYNYDGCMNLESTTENPAVDIGVAGVIVNAYDADGNLVGTTTTAGDGTWQISFTGAAPPGVRVEFSAPTGYLPGPVNSDDTCGTNPPGGPSIQFPPVPSTDINIGVVVDGDYCQSSPLIAVNCLRFGDPTGVAADDAALYVAPYDSGQLDTGAVDAGLGESNGWIKVATHDEIGATWGLAAPRPQPGGPTQIYTSTYHKVHTDYGPGGPGAIYVTDITDPLAPVTSLFANLEDTFGPGVAGPDTRAGYAVTNAGWQETPTAGGFLFDDTWDEVGTTALGGLTTDDTNLYVVNLFDKQLYTLPLADPAGATATPIPLATGAAQTCASGDAYPFAAEAHGGLVYVGVTCTALTSQNPNDLRGYVYSYDPATGMWSTAPVFEFPLNYVRAGEGWDAVNDDTNSAFHPWAVGSPYAALDDDETGCTIFCIAFMGDHEQPMFSGITFDGDDMVISIRDRYGDQVIGAQSSGVAIPGAEEFGTNAPRGYTAGDILRACGTGAGWTLESNGTCGPSTTPGAGTNEGPGGGEFYNQDRADVFAGRHDEISLGAVNQIPGFVDVMGTMLDPVNQAETGGIRFLNNTTGANDDNALGWETYEWNGAGDTDFAKANGLGDLQAICELAPLQIGNYVWIDTDLDGLQDAEEPPVDGVTVNLYLASDLTTPVGTTTTDALGEYYFDDNNVPAGLQPATAYVVEVVDGTGTPLDAYSPTVTDAGDPVADDDIDSDIVDVGGSLQIDLTTGPAGSVNHTYDAGFIPLMQCAVGDFVWSDTDGDGIQDTGEPGVAGATVELLNPDGTPAVDSAGAPVPPATTDANGRYVFDNLTCGEYIVRFTLPTGSTPTTADQGADDAADSDADPITGQTAPFTVSPTDPNSRPSEPADGVTAPTINPTIDAGIAPPELCAVGDFVWIDADADGVQDAGEAPVPGATVELLNPDLTPAMGADGVTPIPPATTDANGLYAFTNVPCVEYVVRFTPPAGSGLTPTTPAQGGDPLVDSNPDPATGVTPPFTPVAGTPDNSIDAGYLPPPVELCAVGDFVWIDADADGVQDVGEAPVPGATVELLNPDLTPAMGADGVTPIAPATTDASGLYAFTNVPCVEYVVRFTPPAGSGLTPTTPAQGGDPLLDSNPDPATGVTPPFTLDPATTPDNSIDAGYLPPPVELCAVGDFVWIDADSDGVQDAGEAPVPGATVELLNPDLTPAMGADGVTPIAPATTDANGLYSFMNVPCVEYVVRFTPPAGSGLTPTTPAQGGDPLLDSNPDPATGVTPAFTPVAGTPDNSIDAGYLPPPVELCAVGDFVWIDADSDGVQDAGEAPVAGATVELLNPDLTPAMGADGVTPIPPATTDANGLYAFTNVPCVEYVVRFTPPAGSGLTPTTPAQGGDPLLDSNPDPATGVTPPFTPVAGTPDNSIDAGYLPPPVELCAVGDFVWIDADSDGVRDAGEAPVPGATVELLNPDLTPAMGADGVTPIPPATTDANGLYSFTNVPCVEYVVRFTPPAGSGLTPTTPAQGGDPLLDSNPDPATGVTPPFTPVAGTPDNSIDAGYLPPPVELCAVGDFVWIDADADGVQDAGEAPVPGATVELLNPDLTPAMGADGVTPIPPATTDANGLYSFTNVPCVEYVVRFTPPAGSGLTPTTPAQGGDPLLDSNPDPATGVTPPFTPVAGTPDNSIDAGYLPPPVELCAVGDFVWIDADSDGVQDAGEAPVPGATVELLNPDLTPAMGADGVTPIAPATTDASGLYAFTSVPCVEYVVRFTPPAGSGLTPTTSAQGGDPLLDSNPDPATGVTPPFTPVAGTPDNSIDAGYLPPPVELCAVGDFVWIDADSDGVQDAGEAPVPGATVELLNPDLTPAMGADGVTPIAPATTDASGLYAFTSVPCVEYVVRFTPPAGSGLTPTTPAQGGDPLLDSNPDPATGVTPPFTPVAGTPDNSIDAGYVEPQGVCSVGDFVWIDGDADGVQSIGEAGLGGVTVTIYAADGTQVATAITDAAGGYSFAGLACQEYYVVFTPPAGYAPSPQGSDPGSPSDSNPDPSGRTPNLTVTPEAPDNPTIDAGFVPVAPPACSAGSLVWLDGDGDGVQDSGEAGVADVTVAIYNAGATPGADAPVATVTTDANGQFLFSGLACGAYFMVFTPPPGSTMTFTTQGGDPASPMDSNADGSGRTQVFELTPGSPLGTTIDAGLVLPTPPAGPPPTSPPVTVPEDPGALPATGSNTDDLVTVALILLALGGFLHFTRRRRRARSA